MNYAYKRKGGKKEPLETDSEWFDQVGSWLFLEAKWVELHRKMDQTKEFKCTKVENNEMHSSSLGKCQREKIVWKKKMTNLNIVRLIKISKKNCKFEYLPLTCTQKRKENKPPNLIFLKKENIRKIILNDIK